MKRIDTATIEILTHIACAIDQEQKKEKPDTLNSAFLLGQMTTISGILDYFHKCNGTIRIPTNYEHAKKICEDKIKNESCYEHFHQITFDEYVNQLANTIANILNKE